MYDLAVVGLGPSGALLAWKAASMGYSVIGYDIAKTYRKPCGDAIIINNEYDDILRKSGSVVGRVDRHIIEIANGRTLKVIHKSPAWYIVDKSGLVGFLREMAVSHGASIRYEFRRPDDLRGFRIIIDSRGPYAFLNYKKYFIMAYRIFVQGADWPSETALLRFETNPPGIFWIFPSSVDGAVNIGGGFRGVNLNETRNYIISFTRKRLGNNVKIVGEAAAPIAIYSPIKLIENNIIKLGEAAGLINSAGGEGIRMALISALRASEALSAGLEGAGERYTKYARDLVVEARLSRRLLYVVESMEPDAGRKLLESLPTTFWKEFLKGNLGYKLLFRTLVLKPGMALKVARALLSFRF